MKQLKTLNLSVTLLIVTVAFSLLSCNSTKKPASYLPNTEDFVTSLNGKNTGLFILKGDQNFTVAITNYGARIVGIYLPDKNGEIKNIVLGFNTIGEYINCSDRFFGPIVGRVANRIAKGEFKLEDIAYHLPVNNGVNHLHGGPKGLHSVIWDVKENSDKLLKLQYQSPDMEEGYPGNLDITVTYSISADNTLQIDYKATTDKSTPINLSSHVYYNLNGRSDLSINDNILQINAEQITPVDSTLIPTGEFIKVAGTPFDFIKPKNIGRDLNSESEQLKYGNGYDHNWVLNGSGTPGEYIEAATVSSPITGISMKILTMEPGIQFYGGNFFNSDLTVSDGHKVGFRCGMALEPQHFPDAVNQPGFPSIILNPGELYSTTSKYIFSCHE